MLGVNGNTSWVIVEGDIVVFFFFGIFFGHRVQERGQFPHSFQVNYSDHFL